MPVYYDDNYGHWDMEDESDVEHYRRTQETNVEKTCNGCGRRVMIQPQYAFCNTCAEKIEMGIDF